MITTNRFVFIFAIIFHLSLFVSLSFQQSVTLYQTSFNTNDRLTQKPSLSFTPFSTPPTNRILIDRTQKFQKIHGFGGAFTDASAVTFASLNKDLQQQILELYWGENGIGYSTGRVHINSCDFSEYSYDFDSVANDTELVYFDTNVTHDTITMIPFIQQANQTFINTQQKLAEKKRKIALENSKSLPQNTQENSAKNNQKNNEDFPADGLKIFASPWSPPAWMKVPVNGIQSMYGSAVPEGLLAELHSTWSLYFLKFIEAYMKHGITLWGLTIQNEPEYAAYYEACVYTAENERDLIINDLGPLIKKHFPYMKILAYDHNRDNIYKWAETMYKNEEAKALVDGIAFHWYVTQQFQNVNATYHLENGKLLLGSEACTCPMSKTYNQTDDWMDWKRGESYGQDIIGDLNNFASGWTDWNLLLNQEGGPNHALNFCDAPIIADAVKQTIYPQITYYYMGHISKFILPNYQRVFSNADVIFDYSPSVSSNGEPDVVFLFNGMNIILWDCQHSPQQQFNFLNGGYIAVNGTNQCLNIQNQSADDHANVQLWDIVPDAANELWSIEQIGDEIEIVSKLNKKCLTLSHSSPSNGANIEMMTCTGDDSQHWVYNQFDGSLRSSLDLSKCVTAGWSPLLNVAFISDDQSIVVVVVMNPSNQLLSFDLFDPLISSSLSIQTSIPPHSIQTYLYPI